jgi:superfamily II DNA/RNA helicase
MQVIVFCTTAKVTSLVAELLSELKLNVREIHSRKPQSYRTRISKEFKESKGLILVSSDVSARGVDYPNVTLVVQVKNLLFSFLVMFILQMIAVMGFSTLYDTNEKS